MTKKVDLNVDIKQSTGEYLPTVYLDFIDVSYGFLETPAADADDDSDAQYSRYSMDPENGTWLHGSLSIYFTKEAFETAEDTAEWLDAQFGDLYVYTFLSPFQSINQQLDQGVLSVKDLIWAFAGTKNRSSFTSSSRDYDAIIAEMKEAFLTGTWFELNAWRTYSLGDHSPDPTITEYDTVDGSANEGECTIEYLKAYIDIPGHWVYERFWGKDSEHGGYPGAAMEGPWTTATGGCEGSGCVGVAPFMRVYLSRTLSAYGGVSGTGSTYNKGTRVNVQKLSDLIYNSDGTTNVLVEGIYDKHGDSIAKIANVPIEFWLQADHTDADGDEVTGVIATRLADLKTVNFIGVVGRNVYQDNSIDIGDRVGNVKSQFKNMGAALFDANFGDITYQEVFAGSPGEDVMQIANQTEEVYVHAAGGEPHPSHPIMSINGTYHATDPINYETVVSTMKQLIQKYSGYVDEERALKENMANLAHILATKDYSVDILLRLQFFRRSYYQKSTNTKSGKLYEAFKRLLYSLNRRVMRQPRLKKIRITNNKIIDSRLTAPNVSYVPPVGSGNCSLGAEDEKPTMAGSGGKCKMWGEMGEAPYFSATSMPDTSKDNAYLPKAWHYLSRRTLNTVPIYGRGLLNEYAQYILEEGMPTVIVDGEVIAAHGTGPGDSTTGFAATSGEIAQSLGGNEGTTEDIAQTWYDHSRQFAEGRQGGIGFDLDPDGAKTHGHGTAGPGGDIVVENTGFFTFDWEKALQSHSMLSFVLSPWRIQRYLGLHVPYGWYRVKRVVMKRKEALFLTTMGEEYLNEIDEEDLEFVTITQDLLMDDSKDYPKPLQCEYSGFLGSGEGDSELYYRYGQPTVRVAADGDIPAEEFNEIDTTDIRQYAESDARDDAAKDLGETHDDDGTADYEYALRQHLERTFADELVWTHPDASTYGYHSTAGSVDHNLEAERKQFLTLINFDLPLGTPSGDFQYKAFANPSNRPSGRLQDYEGQRIRGGYRTLTFQYREYMDDDVAYYNTVGINEFLSRLGGTGGSGATAWAENRANYPTYYDVEIVVEDRSLEMMQVIYEYFDQEFQNFKLQYYNQAMASCSFNNIDDRFNDFFVDGVKAKYPDPKDRHWIRAPYMLNLGRQLFFKTYEAEEFIEGGDDNVEETFTAMKKQSARISKLIGPDDGRLIHLEQFARDYERFLNIIKPQAGSLTTNKSGRRLFGARSGHSATGEADTPYFTYHPVYNRMLDVAGLSSEDRTEDYSTEEVVATRWSNAINKTMTHNFKNSFPINQQIYGDMFLSNIYSWEYEPASTTLTYDVIWEWLRCIPFITSPKRYMMSLHDDEEGMYTDEYWPPEIRGFYDRAGDASPGYSSEEYVASGIAGTLFGDLSGGPVIVGEDSGGEGTFRCASPPGQMSYAGRGMGGDTPDGWTQTQWESFIDQTLLCAFLYRFGYMIAGSMGVQLCRTNFSEFAYEGSDDRGTAAASAGGGYTSGPEGKYYLTDYRLDDIWDYLLEKCATLNHEGDLEAASAAIPGLENLRRASEVLDPWRGSSGLKNLWDGTGSTSPGYIWNDAWLYGIHHVMCPEIVLTEVGALHVDAAGGGMPYWKFMRPKIYFTHMTYEPGVTDGLIYEIDSWKLTTQRYQTGEATTHDYRSEKIALMVQQSSIACGYHYEWPKGVSSELTGRSWIDYRKAGKLNEAEFDYRYPHDCIPPTETGAYTDIPHEGADTEYEVAEVPVESDYDVDLEYEYTDSADVTEAVPYVVEEEESIGFPAFDPNTLEPDTFVPGVGDWKEVPDLYNYDPLGDKSDWEYEYMNDMNAVIVGDVPMAVDVNVVENYANDIAGGYANVAVADIVGIVRPYQTAVNAAATMASVSRAVGGAANAGAANGAVGSVSDRVSRANRTRAVGGQVQKTFKPTGGQ